MIKPGNNVLDVLKRTTGMLQVCKEYVPDYLKEKYCYILGTACKAIEDVSEKERT